MNDELASAALVASRFINKRERAAELQARMLKFSAIYNAGCLLRHAWHGSVGRREECVRAFADALSRELQQAGDAEALIYAVADSLYSSPLGVPWEP